MDAEQRWTPIVDDDQGEGYENPAEEYLTDSKGQTLKDLEKEYSERIKELETEHAAENINIDGEKEIAETLKQKVQKLTGYQKIKKSNKLRNKYKLPR